jgi:hypothetical protein
MHHPAHTAPSTAVTGPVEMGPIHMRATASSGGSKPRLASIVTDLHNMPARYEYISSIVSIVLVLDTLSKPCILGLVRSLTEGRYPR